MIQLITRIQNMGLYERMMRSARNTAFSAVHRSHEIDTEGLPKCAETYNRLAFKSNAEIFCFVEDDVEFVSNDWDRIAEELFAEYDCDILGVVGASEYHGGGYFEAGRENSFGQVACNKSKNDQETWVRVLSEHHRFKKVKVVDGMLMFVRREAFLREPFDEKTFDELFYYDIDLCLKSDKVAITSEILVKHSKPPELYGKYPANMKTVDQYELIFLDRHGLTKRPIGDQTCCFVSLDRFKKDGQTECFKQFERKYKCMSV